MRTGSVALALACTALALRAEAQPAPTGSSPPPPPPASSIPPPPPAYPPGYAPPAPSYPPGYAPPPGYPPPGYPPPPPGSPYPYPYYPPPAPTLAPPPSTPASVMDYKEGQPIPPGYHEDTRVRWPLLEIGGAVFVLTYVPAIYAAGIGTAVNEASGGKKDEFGPLFIPIAGPFVTIATAHASAAGAFWLVIDGVGQVAAVGLAVAGIAAPKHVVVRNDISRAPRIHDLRVAPAIGAREQGLAVTGSF